MADETLNPGGLFGTSPRSKPRRTYSHKRRSSHPVSLPALKPALKTPIPANTGRRRQIVTVQEPDPDRDDAEHDPTAHIYPPVHEATSDTNRVAGAGLQDQIQPTGSQFRHSGDASRGRQPDIAEGGPHDHNDEDDFALSQRPLTIKAKHDRRTANGTRSLRRRPFLIFDKAASKGYKQLKNDTRLTKTPPALRLRPGDGFSGREAKPNGSNLLTWNGKQGITSAPIGMLDLTQTSPAETPRKRSAKRADLDDNSFIPTPKKARRPLEPRDVNQILKPASAATAPVQVKISSSALNTVDESTTTPAEQRPSRGPATVTRPQDTAASEGSQLHPLPTAAGQATSDNDEVDLIIPTSDDVQNCAADEPESRGVLDEAQDSFGSQVSDSPPRHRRARAGSASPRMQLGQNDAEGHSQRVERVLRRAKTQ